VRVERIVLEHHCDVTLFRRQVVHHPLADGDMAAGVITTVPVLILALLSQRYLTRGLALGGVTG
jgi:ABC-type glycerol-3-phosphate transport system permease component